MSIKIQVTAVKRTVSSIHRTVKVTWNETENRNDVEHSIGAEYETVQFMSIEPKEKENYLQVANVTGNAVLTGTEGLNLMLNDPALFGTFKPGDIVELRVVTPKLLDSNEFKQYRREQMAELRPYILGECIPSSVSISEADRNNGSPKVGDMIARNPKNRDDQWLVAEKYFEENFQV